MQIIFDIDELVSAGTVRLSSATLETLKLELETKDSGHHVGDVAFIHSARAATNARLLSEDAQRQYYKEFGVQNPNALEFYRARDSAFVPTPESEKEAADPYPPASASADPEFPDTAPDLAPVPLPDHPAIENEPPAAETPEHAYLREEEAKQVE